MKTSRKRITVVGVFAVITLAVAAAWYFWLGPSGSLTDAWDSLFNPAAAVSPGTLRASGTVETTVLSIASELPGKILEVDFQEGDLVKAGQVLVHLEDGTLKIQRRIAAANLETARLALQQLDSPTVIAALQKTIAQDEQAIIDARQGLDLQKYFTNNADAIQSARSKLYLALVALNKAHTIYDKVKYNNYLDATAKAVAQQNVYRAELAYENALALLNYLTGVPNPVQVDLKTAAVELAEAKLADDQAYLAALNGGTIPENATGAGIARLQQTRIALQAAQAGLDLLDDQIGKMTIAAPVDGVVMSRSADPGDVVTPGAELLSLAHLNDLTITVYIPENQYEKITVGQMVPVTADSFPGETFHAVIVSISAQLVFLTHTTQAVPASQLAVHAIRLELKDAAGKLKPGMTAKASFMLP